MGVNDADALDVVLANIITEMISAIDKVGHLRKRKMKGEFTMASTPLRFRSWLQM